MACAKPPCTYLTQALKSRPMWRYLRVSMSCHCRLVTVRLHVADVYKIFVLNSVNILDFSGFLLIGMSVHHIPLVLVSVKI